MSPRASKCSAAFGELNRQRYQEEQALAPAARPRSSKAGAKAAPIDQGEFTLADAPTPMTSKTKVRRACEEGQSTMTKTYRLEVDPRILELLGPESLHNIYYVLAELIANAYDADAKNVYVIAGKDDIRVEDDGHGMSYKDGDITKYLNVAGVSRTTEKDSLTKSRKRRKMGRKGVGKLAALSVSENVDVLTIAKGEKSGFVLTRHPENGHELKAIPKQEGDIVFERIKSHGSAIIMRHPQYRLHKTLDAVKRNSSRCSRWLIQTFGYTSFAATKA